MISISSHHLVRRTTSTIASTSTRQPLTRRPLTTTTTRPLKLAIIGSGPSGFYTASKILQTLPRGTEHGDQVEVHMYDRLPTPYGLARYGVAPDHPEVKNCQHKFDELAPDPRFRFFGNISIGQTTSPLPRHPSSPYTYPSSLHIPLSTLYAHYTTLLFAYGSSLSTPLPHTPGSSSREDRLENVFPALAFVNWYNGHPAYTHLSPDLSGDKVTIIGQGNVAMDCARVLLKPPHEFEGTDMPSSVIDHLRKSKVKEVELVGRRGPGQVAFTTKEFREMISLDTDEARVRFDWVRGEEMDKAKVASKGDRARSRLLDLMSEGVKAKKKNKKPSSSAIPSEERTSASKSTTPTQAEEKRFKLSFLLSPSAFLSSPQNPSDKKITSIRWTKNTLLAPPSTPADSPPGPPADPASSNEGTAAAASVAAQSVLARPTGEEVVTPTGMVIESVGYRGESIVGGEDEREGAGEEDVPFDKARSRVMNVEGRVTDGSGVMIPGMYTAGWIASGPVGVIASTMQRAYAVASTIMMDHFQSPLPPASSSLLAVNPEMGVVPEFIRRSSTRIVELKDWERIDKAEREIGEKRGKVREKFVSVEDMLKVLD